MTIRGNISRGGVEIQKAALPRRVRGFSLIEMLVVIAVIGILAALLLGALPAISDKKIRSTVRAELRMLTTAIEAYKEKHGFYPPDNTNNIAQPPLYYELVGTTVKNNTFYPVNGVTNFLTSQQVNDNFGMEGFMNSSVDAGEVKNFLTSLRVPQSDCSPYGSANALVLKVPADGPKDPAKPYAEKTNTWKYIVGRGPGSGGVYATNNPNTFDLWADVIIRGRTVTIGNWKEQ